MSFKQLRKKLDGKDPFMTGGHGIIKSTGRSQHNARLQRTPVWATDDKEIQKLLLRSFPKLWIDPVQWERAGRWMRIIQLYFRAGLTSGHIAEEMHLTDKKVRKIISRIRNAAKFRPRGRPKKNDVTL